MEWYQYVAAFFAGAILTNAVPHFIHGISGDRFPSPFSKPMGIALSSARTNMLWALFNLVAGYLLFSFSKADNTHPLSMLLVLAGIAVIGLSSSSHFTQKDKE